MYMCGRLEQGLCRDGDWSNSITQTPLSWNTPLYLYTTILLTTPGLTSLTPWGAGGSLLVNLYFSLLEPLVLWYTIPTLDPLHLALVLVLGWAGARSIAVLGYTSIAAIL